MEFVKYLNEFNYLNQKEMEELSNSQIYKTNIEKFISDETFKNVLNEAMISKSIHDSFIRQIAQI